MWKCPPASQSVWLGATMSSRSPMHSLELKHTNIFKVPEAPKEVVPEKKVSVTVPRKPEAPPALGIYPHCSVKRGTYGLVLFTIVTA